VRKKLGFSSSLLALALQALLAAAASLGGHETFELLQPVFER
jgi:hypothetical protein